MLLKWSIEHHIQFDQNSAHKNSLNAVVVLLLVYRITKPSNRFKGSSTAFKLPQCLQQATIASSFLSVVAIINP